MKRLRPEAFLAALRRAVLDPGGTALLHACAVAVAGRAHVFLGGPRAGKSTLADLAAASGRAAVLDDEIVPLRRARGGLLACGSPFWPGGTPRPLPVAGVYTLRKASRAALGPGDPAALSRLLDECCLNLPAGGPGRPLAGTLAAALRLYRGELSFPKRGTAFLALLGKPEGAAP